MREMWLVTLLHWRPWSRCGEWLHPEIAEDDKENDNNYQFNCEELCQGSILKGKEKTLRAGGFEGITS